MTATVPTSENTELDRAASETAAAAATVVSVFALLIAVAAAGEVGRLSPSVAALLIIGAAATAAIAFRSLFNRAHVLVSAAALALVLMGAGRSATFVLPLVVVVGALHLASIEHRYPRTIPVVRTAAAAGAALFFGLLLEGLTFGPFSNPQSGGGGSSQDRVERGQPEPATEPNAVQRFVERVTEFFRRDDGGQPENAIEGEGPSSSPPPEPDGRLDWIKLLIFLLILAVIIALVALLVRWWRRRVRTTGSSGIVRPDSALRRFEHIGEAAARGRRGSEGPITYGTAVDELTGDQRLSDAGSIVSDYVYRPDGTDSPAIEPATLDRVLADLEASPPHRLEQPPTKPDRLRGFVRRFVNRG